jgi:hypothetical protein
MAVATAKAAILPASTGTNGWTPAFDRPGRRRRPRRDGSMNRRMDQPQTARYSRSISPERFARSELAGFGKFREGGIKAG